MLRSILSCIAATLLASTAFGQGSGSPTLDAVRARGFVTCGVSGTNPGFAFPDNRSEMRGSEADFCRAVACQRQRFGAGCCGTMFASEKLSAIEVGVAMSPEGAMWPRSKPERA